MQDWHRIIDITQTPTYKQVKINIALSSQKSLFMRIK